MLDTEEPVYRCQVEDFSLGGCRVMGLLPTSLGEQLRLQFEFSEQPLFVRGKVRRVERKVGWPSTVHWGIEFESALFAHCSRCRAQFPAHPFDNDTSGGMCLECRFYGEELHVAV